MQNSCVLILTLTCLTLCGCAAVNSRNDNLDMACQIDTDCSTGFNCRSKTGGGTECRAIQSTVKEANQQGTYANKQTAQVVPENPAISSTTSNGALERWTLVGSTDQFTTYHDLSTIQKDGNRVKIWTLNDSKTTMQIDGIRFLSAKIQMEYDCKEDQLRPLAGSVLSGNMGTGDIVHSESNQTGQWQPIEPGSFGEITGKIACGKSPAKQPIQQQNEAGIGTTLLQVLGAAAQGYSQGRQQSAPSINAMPFPRTAHCNSSVSSLSKSVDTTCTQY